ncbi:hypothetical protein BK009_05480 [Methanobacterium subterraneum]|jgi:hypothetical protein|uniref:Alpha/beta hydrolase n=2 Tax=Methanobacteriaceae TaxID=2159 RepID=A0A2H4VQ40_9EURY|nr:hypothetical protein BK009_05480 [Methanobacterium subterraneum]
MAPGVFFHGVNASQNFMKLGTLLLDEFTVYIVDRRGHGMSGPCGSKTPQFLKDSLTALNETIPYSNLVELKGLNHDSAQDYGKPKPIAQELRRFF